jgi:uncharacterized protein YktB (UPF0637 family)
MDNIMDIFTIIVAIVGGLTTIVGTIVGVIKYIRKPILVQLDFMNEERDKARDINIKTLRALNQQLQLVKAGNLIVCEALMQHDTKINGKVKLFRDKYFTEVYSITGLGESQEIADSLDSLLEQSPALDEQLLDEL